MQPLDDGEACTSETATREAALNRLHVEMCQESLEFLVKG